MQKQDAGNRRTQPGRRNREDSQKGHTRLLGDWGQAQTWENMLPPGSGASADRGGRLSGFTDEARHVEGTSEDVD